MVVEDKDITLAEAQIGEEVIVKEIDTDDEELNNFLFTLGCYPGEPVVVVSHMGSNLVVSIKDGRYNIDQELADAIHIEAKQAS